MYFWWSMGEGNVSLGKRKTLVGELMEDLWKKRRRRRMDSFRDLGSGIVGIGNELRSWGILLSLDRVETNWKPDFLKNWVMMC